jgi:hypothetical protein
MPITLSYADAEKAFKEILTQYYPYLPGDVYKLVTAKPITDVYEICDAGKYRSLFDITWNRTFQKANAMLFPGKVFAAGSVPAFTTDVDDISTRKIYLQDGVVNSWGTYYHEAIHYLQHRDLYPLYYATGGQAPFKMEGLTEYLTRYFSTRVARERDNNQSYQKNYLATKSWIGNDLKREGDLFQMNFSGTGLSSSASSAQIVNLLSGIIP